MKDSYIKESIDEVEQYLDKKQSVDELLGQTDKVKSIIMGSNYWNDRKKIIEQVLRHNVCINTEEIVENGEFISNGYQKSRDKVIGYQYSIQGGSVIADLCNVFQVDIPQDLQTKFGPKLDLNPKGSSNFIGNCGEILSNLQKTLKGEISKTFNIDVNTKLSDDQIYQIVSRLPDYEEESKKLLLKSHRKTNEVENLDAELKQPTPDLFKLLEDENLETYINEYKGKSLEERKEDPLRQVFRWNQTTGNRNLDDTTKKQTIQQWFTGLMLNTSQEYRDNIYYVLLELFGKDFEFGGGYNGKITKANLWAKVDKKAVKAWYKKNKIQTDLFDDLEIENEQINIIKNGDVNIKLRPKSRKKTKQRSKTSKTGYKIGLGLDILITAIFAILAIKISLLFLISLIITVPIGIYCGIKLCGCCLGFGDNKIKKFGSGNDDGRIYDETYKTKEFEYGQIRNQPLMINEEYEYKNKNEKPVKIITGIDE